MFISDREFRNFAFIFGILCFASYVLRCYVRLRILKFFGWDDVAMLIALCAITVMSVSVVVNSYTHHATISLKVLLACSVADAVAIIFAQLSVVLFLVRVVQERVYRIILWVAIVFSFMYGTTAIFIVAFQCHPTSKFWHPLEPGHCLSKMVTVWIAWFGAVVWLVTSVMMAVIAILTLRGMTLSTRSKIGAAFIMLLGLFSAVITIGKMPYIHIIAVRPTDPKTELALVSADSVISMWSYLEPAFGIIAGNLATYRPLLNRLPFLKKPNAAEMAAGMAPPRNLRRPTDRLYPTDSVDMPVGLVEEANVDVESKEVSSEKAADEPSSAVHELEKTPPAEDNSELSHGSRNIS